MVGPRKGESNKRASARRRGMVEEEPSIIHILSHKHFQHFLLSTAFLFTTKYALK